MGVKRVIDVSFWTDDKVVDHFSPEDKYFMLYILTNPHTTQLGIYPLSTKIAAFEMGYSQEAVIVLLERFQDKYKIIKWSKETGEIAVKNYLLHSIVKGGKPVYDCLMREYKGVKNKELLNYVWQSVKGKANETVLTFFNNINVNDIENDNENENENEVSPANRGRYVDESFLFGIPSGSQSVDEQPAPKKQKTIRHKYGQYENVLLSDEDMEKLKSEFPYDWQQRIERLSEYIASSGKSYKNHLATIRSWARKDKSQQRYNDKPVPEPEPVEQITPEQQEYMKNWIANRKKATT